MSIEELDDLWAQLPSPPSGELSGVRIGGLPAEAGLWVARDSQGRRHLLVEVPAAVEPLAYETRGLQVQTDELRVGDLSLATYIDLTCLDPNLHRTFAAVSANIVAGITEERFAPRETVVRSLDQWQWFWTVDPAGLDTTSALGLFGELWFMARWLAPVTRDVIEHWHGPERIRHDFQWPGASFEVKATTIRRDGAATHRIAGLEQLDDPETGSLYMFSLQATPDELAANTLPTLVDRIAGELARTDPGALPIWWTRLSQCGYNPADGERYQRRYRVVTEELYKVGSGFPRLTRASFVGGLPPGVESVTYAVDLGACSRFRIATRPTDIAVSSLCLPET